MKRFQNIVFALIDNVPIILTLVFGLFFTTLTEITEVPEGQMLKWILVILSSITIVLLVEKFRSTRNLEQGISGIQRQLSDQRPRCLQGRQGRLNLASEGQHSSTIDILAWTGHNFFVAHETFIRKKVQSGCHVRFIVLDKESDAVKVIMDNAGYNRLNIDVESTEERCRQFVTDLDAYEGSFELRKTKWLTPYGMIVLDMKQPGAVASLGLHPIYLKMSESDQRFITVNASDDRNDFEYFVRQYDALWNSSEQVVSTP
jgi:hypothetical protein